MDLSQFAVILDKGRIKAEMFVLAGPQDPHVVELSGMFRPPLCQLFHNVSMPTFLPP